MLMRFKIFTTMLLLLLFMTGKTFAAMPDISSGSTEFDFFHMCHIFRDNVKVTHQGRSITANRAVVNIPTQKVWASGNVTLIQEGLKFKCDKVLVQGSASKVEVIGNLEFVQDKALKIIADVGTFSWNSKEADFYGHVKLSMDKSSNVTLDDNLNVKKKKVNGVYDHIKYDVVNQKIIALDKKFASIPKAEFSEPDPTGGK